MLRYLMVRSLIFGTLGQPSRDRRLRQYSVHQGAQCSAWHVGRKTLQLIEAGRYDARDPDTDRRTEGDRRRAA